VIETSLGSIEAELFADKAPVSVANFMGYVKDKFYDGTVFHRVMPTFMIQGGGFTSDLKQKATKAAIKNEADNGLKNVAGTLAMARLPEPHTATAEFFINVKDNPDLDHKNKSQADYGYCVFGKVIAGMDVVNKIKDVKTRSAKGRHMQGFEMDMDDVPAEAVTIKSIHEKTDKKE